MEGLKHAGLFWFGLYVPFQCSAVAQNECNNGCAGGLMTNAYSYLMESGGLMEQSAYPYTGAAGPCRFDPTQVSDSG